MTTYYVDTAADPGGNGTTSATTGANCAWDTIADVNAASFLAGDSVLFKRGCTWREQLTVPSSGSAIGGQITFGAYGSGANPIISGADVVTTWVDDGIMDGTEESGGVFATGFEDEVDAMTTDFTGKTTNGTNTVVITTAAGTFKDGAKGGKVTFDGTNKIAYAYKNITDQTDLYVRAYFKLKSDFTIGADYNWVELLSLYDGASELVSLGVQRRGTSGVFRWIVRLNPSGEYVYSGGAAGEIAVNTWYYFELHFVCGTGANGGAVFSVDGVQKGSLLNKNYSANAIDTIRVGNSAVWATGTPGASEIYFDNIKADTSAIGACALASPNIYGATLAADPQQVFKDGVRLTKGASATSLNDHEWFHAGTTLSMRDDSGDPDGLGYVITASVRNNAILVNNKDYITIDSLVLNYAIQNGVAVYGGCSNFTITNCDASYNYWLGLNFYDEANAQDNPTISNNTFTYNMASGAAIGGTSSGAMISGNTAHHNGVKATPILTTPWDCVAGLKSFYAGFTNATFTQNIVYSNGMPAYGENHGQGIWIDTCGTGITVSRNLVYSNVSNGIYIEKTSGVTVAYNVVYSNATIDYTGGITVFGRQNLTAIGNLIYNNTAYNNTYSNFAMQSDNAGTSEVSENLVKNNIFVSDAGVTIWVNNGGDNVGDYGHGNVFANNCLGPERANFIGWSNVTKSTYDLWETAYDGTTASVEADPLFVNAAGADFTLQVGSPCIDTGIDVGLTEDYLGSAMIGIPDIGAYESEFGSSSEAFTRYWEIFLGGD